ncbi:hypothetical protein [Paenibacillus sp. BAC0078]
MAIKKIINASLTELKNSITDKKPIVVVNRRNKEEMDKMKYLVEALSTNQVTFRILKHTPMGTEELTPEMFMNSFELSRQIAEERERIDAILIEEDED